MGRQLITGTPFVLKTKCIARELEKFDIPWRARRIVAKKSSELDPLQRISLVHPTPSHPASRRGVGAEIELQGSRRASSLVTHRTVGITGSSPNSTSIIIPELPLGTLGDFWPDFFHTETDFAVTGKAIADVQGALGGSAGSFFLPEVTASDAVSNQGRTGGATLMRDARGCRECFDAQHRSPHRVSSPASLPG